MASGPATVLAPRRKRSARFVDIAQAAGVSTATVNRVLNERGSVSAETRTRVIAAAKHLSVPRVLPDPRHGLTRFDVVMARSDTPYFQRLNWALERLAQMIDPRILIHRHVVDSHNETQLAQLIDKPGHRRDGLMVALPDSERVRVALRAQVERGVPVAALMSGFRDLDAVHYAGIDNRAAGRTAGHFIARFTAAPGRVLLLTNSLRYPAHAERMAGCIDVLREQGPQLLVNEPVECHDEPERCQQAVAQALRKDDDIVGLYHSGAGSAGVAKALARNRGAHRIAWVGHELSDEHRSLLRDGVLDLVIDQDPDGQVASALHHLMHAAGYVDSAARTQPNEFRLFCAENATRPAYIEAPLGSSVPAR